MIVHVICWDGIEYDRNATHEEIERERKNGNVKEENGIITFDFSLMRKYEQINHSLGQAS